MTWACEWRSARSSVGRPLTTHSLLCRLRSDTVVLVDGLVVGNVSLSAALAGHAERVKADSNTIMTVVVTPSAPAGPQSLHSHLAVAVNAVDGQLYSYVRRERCEARGGWPCCWESASGAADSLAPHPLPCVRHPAGPARLRRCPGPNQGSIQVASERLRAV